MFRLVGTIYKDTHILNDTIVCDDSDSSRTQKVFSGLDTICYEFDLQKPIWLDSNIRDFKRHSITRFHQDNFIEEIEFDYLELRVIEED